MIDGGRQVDDRRTNTQRNSIAYQRRDAQTPAAKQFSMKAISRRAKVFHSKGARRLFLNGVGVRAARAGNFQRIGAIHLRLADNIESRRPRYRDRR